MHAAADFRIRYSKQQLLDLSAHLQASVEAKSELLAIAGPAFEELCSLKAINDNFKRPGRRRNVDRRQRSSRKSPNTRDNLLIELPGDSERLSGDWEPLSNNVELSSVSGNEEPVEAVSEEGEVSEDEETLQPLALYVEGEPDFDLGPPEDGYEYLRRVMWEAAQCPKVVTSRIDKRKITSKQTAYMPAIPPVPVCLQELHPSKEWSKAFVAGFSDLRATVSSYMLPPEETVENSLQLPSIRNKAVWRSFCFYRAKEIISGENFTAEKVKDLDKNTLSFSLEEEPFANESACEILAHNPSLAILMRLDEISRAILFRYHVAWLEEQKNLSYERALWLFALAAVVDSPLDGQTSASFRDLLRKCAELRTDKKPGDEELCMLNILITIAGDYFGQADYSET